MSELVEKAQQITIKAEKLKLEHVKQFVMRCEPKRKLEFIKEVFECCEMT
jgi:superfamily II DNA/RNA helicase